MSKINIVWLKRDLRTQDHLSFQYAEESKLDYRIIYVFEPQLIDYPDTSLRHLQFIYHSILAINDQLKEYNRSVEIFYGDSTDVYDFLIKAEKINQVFSYQESGIQITYDRDKDVKKQLVKNRIQWIEFQRDGIVRGIKNRQGWDKQWYVTMSQTIINNKYTRNGLPTLIHEFLLPVKLANQLKDYPSVYQPAGERKGWRYLQSFVSGRGCNYHKLISKPQESRMSCGRISPYLAWGMECLHLL